MNKPKNNITEDLISKINSNVFFKEFTFSKNHFTPTGTKEELELSDNVVWLEDIFFIIEIKDRNENEASKDDVSWFKNKVLKKAKKQIKKTLKYLSEHQEIIIENEKGHKLDIKKVNTLNPEKVIIYTPTSTFPEKERYTKFYKSSDAGLIHLFHSEDYKWVCNFLFTPVEFDEYFKFRKKLFESFPVDINDLPEQYVLGHYFETLDVTHIDLKYVENVNNLVEDIDKFDMSFLIEKFKDTLIKDKESKNYYHIIKEIALLNRAELREFKKRFNLIIEKASNQEMTEPYLLQSLNTMCGFVFIPILFRMSQHWENAMKNYTQAAKYVLEVNKCIGLVVYKNPKESCYELQWLLIEDDWKYNQEMEDVLEQNYPFRRVKKEKVFKYFIKDNE